jgi:DNA-binding LacI/PurR family transcriptional regulator
MPVPPETAIRRTKHETLTETLRGVVATLPPGERLPSQTELMQRYGVSDRTVLRSLEDLRRDGWIVRRRGAGTFVSHPSDRIEAARSPQAAPPRQTVAALALTPAPSPFYQRCLEVLARVVEEAGWSLVCHHAQHDLGGEEMLPLEALHPRAFVAFNYQLAPVARRLQRRGHRTVILGAPPIDVVPEVSCVFGDHDHGGYLATRHLLELGHRRLAFVRRGDMPEALLFRSFRWRGHERALDEARRAGETVRCVLLSEDFLAPRQSDPAQVAAFFRGPGAPTALVVWNDSVAIPLLSMLHHAGLRIPQDLSVVGYDALPEGMNCLPPLTTVDQHLEPQLRWVAHLLAQEDPLASARLVVLIPKLVVRATTGPPPAR